jgi:hypothetical protein
MMRELDFHIIHLLKLLAKQLIYVIETKKKSSYISVLFHQ